MTTSDPFIDLYLASITQAVEDMRETDDDDDLTYDKKLKLIRGEYKWLKYAVKWDILDIEPTEILNRIVKEFWKYGLQEI